MPLLPPSEPRASFERQALPHLQGLYRLAYRLSRQPKDAEDLVQETMLRAFRFWDRFDGTNCRAWLFKILHNCFINRYRGGQRDRELGAALAPAEGEGATVSSETLERARDPEGTYLSGLLSEDIRRALDGLPADFREAVVLCDLEELSYKEIAEIMDCPIGTVMSRLYRGRRLLQAALHGYAVERGIVKPQAGAAQVIPLRGGDR